MTLHRRVIAALGLTLVVGLTTAPTALAGPPTAFDRCKAHSAPSATYHLSIVDHGSSVVAGDPTNFWPGDNFRITATGSMHTSLLAWDNYTPDGRDGDFAPKDAAWPGPGLKKFSLVGAFGSVDPASMQFGSTVWCTQVPQWKDRTSLRLWINDDVVADNSGRWDITVEQYYR